MTLAEFLREYERRTNTHRFEEVAPLIADDATYWFSDGIFQGKDAIRRAFEQTWEVIKDEHYTIANVQWLVDEEQASVCTYFFHWQGNVDGEVRQGTGRGTSVLRKYGDDWKVVHEHLSPLP
jgi:ketosteroid isomerase-like protein